MKQAVARLPGAWRRRESGLDSGEAVLRWLESQVARRRFFFEAEDARRQGCGRKKRLPRSPFYSRGVVTATVTTPPGSPVGWDLCG